MPILTLKVTHAIGENGSPGQRGSVARLLTAAAQKINSHTGHGYVSDPAGSCSWVWFAPDEEAPKK
jgi:hypothetical protein